MGEWTKAKTKDFKMESEETVNESLTSTDMTSPSIQIQQEKKIRINQLFHYRHKNEVFFRSFI